MSFIYLFLLGILIGSAMVVPGVSGAVIAIIFGVYDKMIDSFVNIFKNFKKNFFYLFVLGSGILIGMVWFSNILMFLYKTHEDTTLMGFIGLILGGVPFLFKEVKKRNEKINFFVILSMFTLSLGLWQLSKEKMFFFISNNYQNGLEKYLNFFLSGIIYSIGKVVPGVSGSFLMIVIGMYDYVLSVMAHPITVGIRHLDCLLPFLVGLIIGIIILLKFMNYLFENKFGLVYSIIIGFVLGSLLVLLPNTISVFGVFIMVISFVLSYKLTKT